MTEAQAVEAIAAQWKAGWEALHPNDPQNPAYVPYALDDEEFASIGLWARLSITHSTRTQMSMGPAGSRRFRHTGNIGVQLFGDVNRGRLQLSQLADDARTVLEAISITVGRDQIATQGGVTRENKTDGRWAQCTVVVGFWYTDVR